MCYSQRELWHSQRQQIAHLILQVAHQGWQIVWLVPVVLCRGAADMISPGTTRGLNPTELNSCCHLCSPLTSMLNTISQISEAEEKKNDHLKKTFAAEVLLWCLGLDLQARYREDQFTFPASAHAHRASTPAKLSNPAVCQDRGQQQLHHICVCVKLMQFKPVLLGGTSIRSPVRSPQLVQRAIGHHAVWSILHCWTFAQRLG